jgi:PAS domain-containing protein
MYEETQEALREKRDYTIEFRIVLPDGTVKYLETTGHHVFSARGELVKAIGTNVDLTERKRAEKALRESETKIRRLVDANIIGIFIWDGTGFWRKRLPHPGIRSWRGPLQVVLGGQPHTAGWRDDTR